LTKILKTQLYKYFIFRICNTKFVLLDIHPLLNLHTNDFPFIPINTPIASLLP